VPPFKWVCLDVQVPRRRALYWDPEISLPFELGCSLDNCCACYGGGFSSLDLSSF